MLTGVPREARAVGWAVCQLTCLSAFPTAEGGCYLFQLIPPQQLRAGAQTNWTFLCKYRNCSSRNQPSVIGLIPFVLGPHTEVHVGVTCADGLPRALCPLVHPQHCRAPVHALGGS